LFGRAMKLIPRLDKCINSPIFFNQRQAEVADQRIARLIQEDMPRLERPVIDATGVGKFQTGGDLFEVAARFGSPDRAATDPFRQTGPFDQGTYQIEVVTFQPDFEDRHEVRMV
jgi:hypothetical protein